MGPDDVAEYYDSQPLGLRAAYRILEHRRLADDLILGYTTVDFSFTDRPTLTVYLSVILRQVGDSWLIAHYQVSRLPADWSDSQRLVRPLKWARNCSCSCRG